MNEQTQLHIYNTITSIVETICPREEFKNDLIHDIFLTMVEKPPSMIDDLIKNNGLNYYISKVITNNVKSSTSPFYNKYKKFLNITDDISTYRSIILED